MGTMVSKTVTGKPVWWPHEDEQEGTGLNVAAGGGGRMKAH